MRHQSHTFPHRFKRRGAQWRQHKYRQQLVQQARRTNHTNSHLETASAEHREEYTYDPYEGERQQMGWDTCIAHTDGNHWSLLENKLDSHLHANPSFIEPNTHESTDLDHAFHTLRNILAHPDRPTAWDALCRLLQLQSNEADLQALVAYAQTHTADWPPEVLKMSQPKHAAWPLAKSIALHHTNLDDLIASPPHHVVHLAINTADTETVHEDLLHALSDAFPMLSSLEIALSEVSEIKKLSELSSLRSLHLRWLGSPMYLFRALPALQQLETLHLHFPLQDDHWCVPYMPQLNSLTLQSNQSTIDMVHPRDWTSLTSLRLIDTELQVSPMRVFPYIQTLHIENSTMRGRLGALCACRKLTKLTIERCQVTALEIPPAFEQLQHLSIKDCHQLAHIDGVEHCQALRSLHITNSRSLTSIVGIQALKTLTKLTLPVSLESEGLEELSALENLRECTLIGCVETLPQLPLQLQKLTLIDCGRLNAIGDEVSLPALQHLRIEHASQLENIDGLKHSNQLKSLVINASYKLQDIAPIQSLTGLRELDLAGCYNLKSLRGIGGVAKSLRTLCLDGLWGLCERELEILAQCNRLEYLSSKGVRWVSLSPLEHCQQLQELTITDCDIRMDDWHVLQQLSSLQKLTVPDENATAGLGAHPTLTHLCISQPWRQPDLSNLTGLRSLYSLHIARGEALQNLSGLEALPQLRELSLGAVSLPKNALSGLPLQLLRLKDCSVESKWDPLLPSLVHLVCEGSKVMSRPPRVGSIPSLRTLSLHGCTQLNSFSHLHEFGQRSTNCLEVLLLPCSSVAEHKLSTTLFKTTNAIAKFLQTYQREQPFNGLGQKLAVLTGIIGN